MFAYTHPFKNLSLLQICDSDLNILSVDASFGGATHDAYIWKQSEIPGHLQQLHRSGESIWLLGGYYSNDFIYNNNDVLFVYIFTYSEFLFIGDSGYPLRPWLLTPIVNAEPGSAEEHYTNVHCLTRNTVERCIGVLKARWRCLLAHRVLHYDHHMVAKIINAVLHNLANRHRLPVPELSSDDVQEDLRLQINVEPPNVMDDHAQLESGRQQRSFIVQRLWRARRT